MVYGRRGYPAASWCPSQGNLRKYVARPSDSFTFEFHDNIAGSNRFFLSTDLSFTITAEILARSLAIASWIHSYFDNVMTKFMINNRTDAWKADANLSLFNACSHRGQLSSSFDFSSQRTVSKANCSFVGKVTILLP